MTPQQLEVLVLAAVERARKLQPIEDDRIEVKREWPEPAKKASQLAGSANRARGEVVIYVIGVDEKTGLIHNPGSVEPAVWVAQVAAEFDGVPPDFLLHQNVPIDENESVVAILFGTDRAPYVVKTSGGNSEFDVPIRELTRTRSARRDELLRMLVPTTAVPPLLLLDCRRRNRLAVW